MRINHPCQRNPPKTGVMQQTCDTVRVKSHRKSPKGEIQGSDDNGRHVFECHAFSHDV